MADDLDRAVRAHGVCYGPVVRIRFLPQVRVPAGYRAGALYEVDSALAAHFCDSARIAVREDRPSLTEDRALHGAPNDRSMRGRERAGRGLSTADLEGRKDNS